MTQLILNQANFLQNTIRALLDLFKDLQTRHEVISQAKQTIRELSMLSDAELNDIGICRGDIWNIAHNKTDSLRRCF